MNVLLLGATGTLGTALAKKWMAETDYRLTLFSRHAEDVYSENERVAVVNGDATGKDLEKVLPGQDVVCCAISGKQLPKVAENLVARMPKAGVKRLIFMGATGIYNEIPEEMDGKDNLDQNPEQIPNRRAVDIVEASSLAWTVLCPGYLRDGDADDYVLTFRGEPAKGYISTISSVVHLIMRLLEGENLYFRQSVGITRDMR
ncbi:MAG: NAD(P)H-binding protein [Planctomycetia bacterium]|nr:NAD(P)H-binding protein [Planctomycetia bacterium]